MLVKVLPELQAYNNVVVTLFDDNRFGNKLKCDKYVCLHLTSLKYLPLAFGRLKKIIRENNATLVHSHLFWPTFIARMATPKNIPLINTIHTSIASSIDYKRAYIQLLDKISYRFSKPIIIAVSNIALNDYFKTLKLRATKYYVLYNFAAEVSVQKNDFSQKKIFRFISTGSLRPQKNYGFLINAFTALSAMPVELHIYGGGTMLTEMQQQITQAAAKIYLHGEVDNVDELLPQFDGYISASQVEGFSLSILEAMAAKVPLLLSNIPSFVEQCADTATYFDLQNQDELLEKINAFIKDDSWRQQLAIEAFEKYKNNYTLLHHVSALKKIYSAAIRET